jgi:molybdenum cofactor cytidylyltransferase
VMVPAVSGVVLAAGSSRRFGDRPTKQLVSIDGEPLVRRVVGRVLSSKLSEVIVVVGKAASEVESACQDLEVRTVFNSRFVEGLSLSVRTGLAAVDLRADAVMFIPVDQPDLTPRILDALIDAYGRTRASIVVPTYRGQRASPVLFDRSLFGELAGLEGDAGGRQLFSAHRGEIVEVPLNSAAPLRDLDTLEDLEDREAGG